MSSMTSKIKHWRSKPHHLAPSERNHGVAHAFLSRRWVRRRPQQPGIFLHSPVEEVLPADETRTRARARQASSQERHPLC